MKYKKEPDMSSPARQTGNRKLPPLAGASRKSPQVPSSKGTSIYLSRSPVGHRNYGRFTGGAAGGHYRVTGGSFNQRNAERMMVKGRGTALSNGYSRYQRHLLNNHHGNAESENIPEPALQEQVRHYLSENPAFLEDYVLSHVHTEELERWLHILQGHRLRPSHSASKEGTAGRSASAASSVHGPVSPRPKKYKKQRSFPSQEKHQERRKLLFDLTQDVTVFSSRAKILDQLAQSISTIINADSYTLYLVSKNRTDLYNYKCEQDAESDAEPAQTWSICKGRTIAGYIASTTHTVNTTHLSGGDKYPEGIAVKDVTANAVLGIPLQQSNEDVIGVIEFYRSEQVPFSDREEELAGVILLWGSLAIYYAQYSQEAFQDTELYVNMVKQRKLNDFLLAVTKSIFQDIVSMDNVIMKIMNFAQKLVMADRASLFLVDHKTNELYARIFDVGNGMGNQVVEKDQKEIRFPMDKGVAGYVASSSRTLNIVDAYDDDRFNRAIDQQTGYITKSILCMPIYNRGKTIGVVQMVNKKVGSFTKGDEQAFETFAVYCGLALHHAKLYDKIHRSEQKYRVALEVLSYHSQCQDNEYRKLRFMSLPEPMPDIARYDFSPWGLDEDAKPLYVLCMFQDMFNIKEFDYEELCRFILTVRKNYRTVPYHNWTHAFSVAHSVYTIIKTAEKMVFNPLECLALFVGCLCHDLDHRGKNNAFMVNTASPLAAIYSTSTMEHHHFNMTITILQNEGHNIFKHLTSQEYKTVLREIRHAILATDLALFFKNKDKLKKIVETDSFDWENIEHRDALKGLMMTGSDLAANTKPWYVTQQTVKVIFDEFYEQGDQEKAQGRDPIPMMDRERAHELPANQVSFIVGICLPCYDLLQRLVPNSKPMYDGAKANLQNWSAIVAKQNAEKEEKEKKEAEESEMKEEAGVKGGGDGGGVKSSNDNKDDNASGGKETNTKKASDTETDEQRTDVTNAKETSSENNMSVVEADKETGERKEKDRKISQTDNADDKDKSEENKTIQEDGEEKTAKFDISSESLTSDGGGSSSSLLDSKQEGAISKEVSSAKDDSTKVIPNGDAPRDQEKNTEVKGESKMNGVVKGQEGSRKTSNGVIKGHEGSRKTSKEETK